MIITFRSFHIKQNTHNLEYKNFATRLKSIGVIVTVALSTIASAYIAYQHPKQWFQFNIITCLANLYIFPKALHFGNEKILKIAILTNLISINCLWLGGLFAGTFSVCKASLDFKLKFFLYESLIVTGLLGYGIPFLFENLKLAYDLVTQPNKWQNSLNNMKNQFHKMPELGLGFLQCNLYKNILFQACFLLRIFPDIFLSNHIFHSFFTFLEVDLESFKKYITDIDNELSTFTHNTITDSIRNNIVRILTTFLVSLNEDNRKKAILMLFRNCVKYYSLLSANFLEIFENNAVMNSTQLIIDKFADSRNGWDGIKNEFEKLEENMKLLVNKMKNFNSQSLHSYEKKEILENFDTHAKEFTRLKDIISDINDKKYPLSRFYLLNKKIAFPHININKIANTLRDENFLNLTNTFYEELTSTNISLPGINPTLSDNLEEMSKDIINLKKNLENATNFLTKMGFANEFENLKKILNLRSNDNLEKALENIGLCNEIDFYTKNIILTSTDADGNKVDSSKSEILANLKNYIQQSQKNYRLFGLVQLKSNLSYYVSHLMNLVTKVVYHLIYTGLVLAPVIIYPRAGIAGLFIGIPFCIGKRFGAPGTQKITDTMQELLSKYFCGDYIRKIFERKAFSINHVRNQEAHAFLSANFFERMQMISKEIFKTIFLTNISIILGDPFFGILIQGVVLSDEIVNLV